MENPRSGTQPHLKRILKSNFISATLVMSLMLGVAVQLTQILVVRYSWVRSRFPVVVTVIFVVSFSLVVIAATWHSIIFGVALGVNSHCLQLYERGGEDKVREWCQTKKAESMISFCCSSRIYGIRDLFRFRDQVSA